MAQGSGVTARWPWAWGLQVDRHSAESGSGGSFGVWQWFCYAVGCHGVGAICGVPLE